MLAPFTKRELGHKTATFVNRISDTVIIVLLIYNYNDDDISKLNKEPKAPYEVSQRELKRKHEKK